MSRCVLVSIALFLASGFIIEAPGKEDRIRVLFLGDKGHHRPADRAGQITPVLALRGIDLHYTERVEDLNRRNLDRYDALLIYANIEQISPERERALIDYVEGGGGFVPVHCASFCFLNSDRYVALLGARFLRHGTGEFDTKIVAPAHPVMKGFEAFRTWDETYVHERHNPSNRHVLQTRVEGEGEEPWTWTRTQGQGRVFYTAYGHDGRTWQNPGFHDLLERGIRWAAGRSEIFDSRPRIAGGTAPFRYEDAETDIPNYLPGAKWGTLGAPYRRIPRPLSPGESSQRLMTPLGFEARLFAAEPEITKPICMAWDHRGRLWIAESIDYPNTKRDAGTGRDQIKICEDKDGDGKADTFTIFAEGLNIPSSLCFSRGGVIVHQAPDTLFLRDTNGDDRADETRVLFTGWGTRDTHAGPSNLRYGLDNWIWGIVGYSAFHGIVGGERHDFAQGFYRFKPDGSRLEFLRSTNNNSWGLGFSEEGLVFGSTANGCPSVYLPIPNRFYESVRGMSPGVLQKISVNNQFFPATEKVRQVDWHGGYTAAAGHALYTARAYPRAFWNSTAFVAEPTGHLVSTFVLLAKGADFEAFHGWNMLASDDEWTAPIMAEVGPDGNVWAIDWYNYIVQHNPTPQGFQTGKGNAYETPLRDRTHGRIYRIVPKGVAAVASRPSRLDPENAAQLVEALKSDNQLWRLHAQRLLVERGRADVLPALRRMAKDPALDGIGLNPGAIHALWTMQGLGATADRNAEGTASAVTALRHPSAGVRRNALLVLPREASSIRPILEAGSLADSDAQVRLSALLTMSELPASKEAAKGIVDALLAGAAGNDRWLADAATSAGAAHDAYFLEALASKRLDGTVPDPLTIVVERVAEHHGRGAPADKIGRVLTAWVGVEGKGSVALADALVTGLARGWPQGKPVSLDSASENALVKLATRVSTTSRTRLVGLASRWGTKALESATAEIVASLLEVIRRENTPDWAKLDAARQLVEFRPDDERLLGSLIEQITPRTSPELTTGILDALSRSTTSSLPPRVLDALPAMTPGARSQCIRILLSRADWTPALLGALEDSRVRVAELALDQKQALTGHPDKAIATRFRSLLAKGGNLPDPDRQKVIDQLGPLALKGGDAALGAKVFEKQCAKCHRHGGQGGQVGPDLTGMAAHPKSELLVHILDPSRSVEGNYVQYTVATRDGRILNGLLASESRTTVELLDAEAKRQVVLRDDIDELVASKKSLMPEGFEKQISSVDLANLLAFLTRHGKYLPLDLRKAATVVSTRGMFHDQGSMIERLVFADWSPKSVDGVPFLLVDPQGDRVPNVVMLHSPNGEIPPKMPQSVDITCHAPARVVHLLSGVSGWGYGGGAVDSSVSMIVRLHYADGKTEDHPLLNGVHFADYIRRVDVPGSKLAFMLRDQQLRYLKIAPARDAELERIELVKGPDQTAPLVMGVTLETE